MTETERNVGYLYWEVFFYGALSGIIGTFLSVYALRLGATNDQVGLLTALPALINTVWLIPAGRIVEREGHRLRIVLLSGFLHRLAYLVAAWLPPLIGIWQAELYVALVALAAFPTAMATVAFTSMFADVVPGDARARVVSNRNLFAAFSSTAAALLGGRFLELLPTPLNYQILFSIGFALSMVSLWFQSRLTIPHAPGRHQADTAIAQGSLTVRLHRIVATLSGERGYVRFSLGVFLYHWGLFLPIPLYPIYWVRELHASDGLVGLIGFLNTSVLMMAYPWWGRFAGRRGHAVPLVIGALGLGLYPLITAFITVADWLVLPSIGGGIFNAAWNLALFNRLLEVSPGAHRPLFVATFTSLINLASFVAPLMGTMVAAPLLGIHGALLLGAGLRFAGALALWYLNR